MLPLASFLACAWHGPVPVALAQGGAPSPVVVAMDRTAYNHVLLLGQTSRVLDDGRIEVSVELQNRDATELGVHYDVQFHATPPEDDASDDEARVRVETTWQLVRLPASGSAKLVVASQEPGPASYTVELWVP
jgi:hypothetical protein